MFLQDIYQRSIHRAARRRLAGNRNGLVYFPFARPEHVRKFSTRRRSPSYLLLNGRSSVIVAPHDTQMELGPSFLAQTHSTVAVGFDIERIFLESSRMTEKGNRIGRFVFLPVFFQPL